MQSFHGRADRLLKKHDALLALNHKQSAANSYKDCENMEQYIYHVKAQNDTEPRLE